MMRLKAVGRWEQDAAGCIRRVVDTTCNAVVGYQYRYRPGYSGDAHTWGHTVTGARTKTHRYHLHPNGNLALLAENKRATESVLSELSELLWPNEAVTE